MRPSDHLSSGEFQQIARNPQQGLLGPPYSGLQLRAMEIFEALREGGLHGAKAFFGCTNSQLGCGLLNFAQTKLGKSCLPGAMGSRLFTMELHRVLVGAGVSGCQVCIVGWLRVGVSWSVTLKSDYTYPGAALFIAECHTVDEARGRLSSSSRLSASSMCFDRWRTDIRNHAPDRFRQHTVPYIEHHLDYVMCPLADKVNSPQTL